MCDAGDGLMNEIARADVLSHPVLMFSVFAVLTVLMSFVFGLFAPPKLIALNDITV